MATHLVPWEEREAAQAAVRQAVARGERAFVIHPRVEQGSDRAGRRPGIEDRTQELAEGSLVDLRLGVLHLSPPRSLRTKRHLVPIPCRH